MLENPTPTAADSSTVKRYAPPNQRNRSLNRRKSGDRFDRTNNSYGNDGEKNQPATARNNPAIDHGDIGGGSIPNEDARPGLIVLEGCSRSEAAQLLKDRWAAAMQLCNDPSIGPSEKPVMCSGSSDSALRNYRLLSLPHQMMSSTNNVESSSGSQMDFLAELRRQMRNANANAKIDN
ncbi:hypothetical protein SLA2020_190150 [Shorea laevis]